MILNRKNTIFDTKTFITIDNISLLVYNNKHNGGYTTVRRNITVVLSAKKILPEMAVKTDAPINTQGKWAYTWHMVKMNKGCYGLLAPFMILFITSVS